MTQGCVTRRATVSGQSHIDIPPPHSTSNPLHLLHLHGLFSLLQIVDE